MEVESKICPSCQEKNNPSFSACWKCGIDFTTGKIPATQPQVTNEQNLPWRVLGWIVAVALIIGGMFFIYHANYVLFWVDWKQKAKESSSKIKDIACKKPFNSRGGVCTFSGSQSELDKIVTYLGLKEIVTHSVTPPKDEHGNPISGLKSGDLPESFGCEVMNEFSVVGFTDKVRYLRPEVHVYTPSDPDYYSKWHDDDGPLNRGVHFQTLYYNSQSQIGCVDLNHPYG